MNLKAASTLFLLASLSVQMASANEKVAKVVLMKGLVKAKLTTGEVIDVTADQSLPEGAVLQTAEKSFAKLLFIDKSTMVLGPNSQMVINSFPKKEAGIITLVKGQIRSQVTKDYMEMDDKSKSKLYIKTKTAAMGIRGTDFQVNFNPENHNTSLITYEGKVAMASIEKNAPVVDRSALERTVSSDKAVLVEHGQISAVNLNVAARAMLPTKLGLKQIQALEANETGVKEGSAEDKKQYKNPIPPGADGAAFSNASPELAAELKKISPIAATELAKKSIEVDTSNPNGYFNDKTGEYKMPAGSIIDLNTVNIIPPPINAVYDANTNTYVVPETYGKIDTVTGEYKAPEGLALGHDGKFVLVDAEAYQKAQAVSESDNSEESKKEENKKEEKENEKEDGKSDEKSDAKSEAPSESKGESKEDIKSEEKTASTADSKGEGKGAPKGEGEGRAPASLGAAPTVKLELPKIYDARPEMANFATKFAASPIAPPLPPPPMMNPTTLQNLATEVLKKTETVRNTATDLGTNNPTSKVKFIFNAP